MRFGTVFFVVALLFLVPLRPASGHEMYKSGGTVVKLNQKANSITLKMDAVPKLNWPPMTMDFETKDKKGMEGLKPGQRVDFDFVEEPAGRYLIIRISPSK